MSRQGVTYQDIEKAANLVKTEGMNVTIENVRAVLKTGSIGTINKHLRKWKHAQNVTTALATKEEIPEALVDLVKNLWEQIVDQSEDRITTLEEKYQAEMAELDNELIKYKGNNQRWQQMFHQWQEEKAALSNDKLALEQQLERDKENISDLAVKQELCLQQLREKQDRIDELHRFHKQAQQNLEHYREAAREQRLLDQRQFEIQKNELQTSINGLNELLAQSKDRNANLEQRYQLLQQKVNDDETVKSELLAQTDLLRQQLTESEKIKSEVIYSESQSRILFEEANEKLLIQTKNIIGLEIETKVLSQQLASTKQTLDDIMQAKNLLSNEKWILAQEKAGLEGQMKQMQVMLESVGN